MKISTAGESSFDALLTIDAYRASRRTEQEVYDVDLELSTGSPYLVANKNQTYGVAVPVGSDWLARYEAQQHHSELKLVTVTTFHRDGRDYLQASLAGTDLLPTFGMFVDNLLEKLGENEDQDPGAVTMNLIAESQRLFRAASTSVPSLEEQVGLLLELEVLYSLYESVGPDIIRRWTGPDSERHDFELRESSLECKATLARESLSVTVHGAQQLDPLDGKPLALLVRKYEKTIDGGTSVPDMVRRIIHFNGIDLDEIAQKLAEAGLSPEVLDKDTEFARFNHVESHEFDIVEDFPRIPADALPGRVSQVSYTVELNDPSAVAGHRSHPVILKDN